MKFEYVFSLYFPIFDYLGAVFIWKIHIEAQFAFFQIDGLNVIHAKNITSDRNPCSEKSVHISIYTIYHCYGDCRPVWPI